MAMNPEDGKGHSLEDAKRTVKSTRLLIKINTMKKFLLLVLLVLSLPVLGQLKDHETIVIEREARYAGFRHRVPIYVEFFPDTLYYNDSTYFFRSTPIHLKQGYTDLVHDCAILSDYWDEGIKGYHLTWLIRNDSLFIRNATRVDTLIDWMYPTKYLSFSTTNNHEDYLLTKIEDFVGSKSRDGVLFVDWITGSFGVLRSFKWTRYSFLSEDDRPHGLIFEFEKGKLVGVIKDEREKKH
jgi:hypothetical protein